MDQKNTVSIFDLTLCVSQAVDFISPLLVDHHKRVAYIAFMIGRELGLPLCEQQNLALAGALHDIGALVLQDRIDILDFETGDEIGHCEPGYRLLSTFPPFFRIAEIVRFHHVSWEKGTGMEYDGKPVPLASHMLHLADRISVLIKPGIEIFSQVEGICGQVTCQAGKRFHPDHVEAFAKLAKREHFWLDISFPSVVMTLTRAVQWDTLELDSQSFLELTKLFCRIIDFRSPFTSAHSSGVAVAARALASHMEFNETECLMMETAGYLHDLGKLAVPTEILEKLSSLNAEEFNLIRQHSYFTDRILEGIPALDIIRGWSALHHEKLNGGGYPFHLMDNEIPVGSRIIAVADVFVALTEDRPYRKGMDHEDVLQILKKMVDDRALDGKVVTILRERFQEINQARIAAQREAINQYETFRQR